MKNILSLAGCVALMACTNNAAQNAALVQAAIASGTTLATVAAANNTTAAKIVASGQALCQTAPGLVAALGVNVVGMPAQYVADVCTALGGKPTALPAGVSADTVAVVVPATVKAP